MTYLYLQSTQGNRPKKAREARKGKGREKRSRNDDIPPEPTLEEKGHYDKLMDLRKHLRCAEHSKPGSPVYCWTEQADLGGKTNGGHREISHEEMTLWAKHIVSKKLYERDGQRLTGCLGDWPYQCIHAAKHKEK